jgi:hypothetical protein
MGAVTGPRGFSIPARRSFQGLPVVADVFVEEVYAPRIFGVFLYPYPEGNMVSPVYVQGFRVRCFPAVSETALRSDFQTVQFSVLGGTVGSP